MQIRRTFRLLVAAGCLAPLAGCLGGTTEHIAVTGIYELSTVNGKALPYTFSNGVSVTKELLTINTDGSFTDVTTRADGSVISNLGSYSNFGGTVNFIDQTIGVVYQGMVSGTQLTIKIGDYSSVFFRTGAAPK